MLCFRYVARMQVFGIVEGVLVWLCVVGSKKRMSCIKMGNMGEVQPQSYPWNMVLEVFSSILQ